MDPHVVKKAYNTQCPYEKRMQVHWINRCFLPGQKGDYKIKVYEKLNISLDIANNMQGKIRLLKFEE